MGLVSTLRRFIGGFEMVSGGFIGVRSNWKGVVYIVGLVTEKRQVTKVL